MKSALERLQAPCPTCDFPVVPDKLALPVPGHPDDGKIGCLYTCPVDGSPFTATFTESEGNPTAPGFQE